MLIEGNQSRTREGRIVSEVTFDTREYSGGQLVLITVVSQFLFLIRVADECRLDQDRWNVGRLEDGKACLLDFRLMQMVDIAYLGEDCFAEFQAVVDRCCLGQIQQSLLEKRVRD